MSRANVSGPAGAASLSPNFEIAAARRSVADELARSQPPIAIAQSNKPAACKETRKSSLKRNRRRRIGDVNATAGIVDLDKILPQIDADKRGSSMSHRLLSADPRSSALIRGLICIR